jgi:hypothetical protein
MGENGKKFSRSPFLRGLASSWQVSTDGDPIVGLQYSLEVLMHRNISRAYYALMAEHHRVRAAHMKILARGDAMLERKLMRAKEDDEAHIEEVVIHEERLSAAQRRRAYKLSSYGRKIEKLIDALLKL